MRACQGLLLWLCAGIGAIAWTAAGADGASGLLDTTWTLTRLGDTPLPPGPEQRRPHLSLQRKDGRVSAWLGCNAASGSYTLDGAQLAFGPMRSTRMACRDGMSVEHGLAEALGNTARWSMSGGELELYDAAGVPLARFAPGPPP